MSTTVVESVEALSAAATSADPSVDIVQDASYVRVAAGTEEGFGETHSSPSIVAAVIDAHAGRTLPRSVADVLIGRDAHETERLMAELAEATAIIGGSGVVVHALSALEQALHDVRGKFAGIPVWKILNPDAEGLLGPAAYATLWAPGTETDLAALAVRAKTEGLAGVKVAYTRSGVPGGDERAFLRRVREAIGSGVDLMVDLQCRGDYKTLPARLLDYAQVGIAWVEEPFPTDRLDLYERLASDSAVPIAAGERETNLADFRRLLDAGVSILQPDLGRCGGLRIGCRVAEMARTAGARAVPHGWGTGVNLAANVHWAVATQSDLVEYCAAASPLSPTLVSGYPTLVDGRFAVPSQPGLGTSVSLNASSPAHVTGSGSPSASDTVKGGRS
jgi:D-galactarolactone cycloisomerase